MALRPLVLLVDTTVLYSAVIYKGLENRVLLSGDHIFITTEFVISEIQRIIITKGGLSRSEAQMMIRSMPILIAESDLFKNKLKEADELMGKRDRSDVPLVALALSIDHDGIWSTDKDFDVVKGRFKVWKTRELLRDKYR
jgi:predicted nucleic acid-binding protein